MAKYKSIDLFAGIGGIRLGFDRAFGDEISTVFVSEWDEYAQKTYKANFYDNFEIAGDITKINEKNQKDLNNAYALAQKEFENKMDKLYEDKIKQIRAINEEYDSEIFRLTKYCNDEKKDKKVYKDPSINEIILKQIKQDKEDELKKCESIFKIGRASCRERV